MSIITFQCYSCHATLKVGADKAGKKAKCRCGTILTIPAAADAITESKPASSAKRPAKTALAGDNPFEDEEAPPKKRSKLDMDEGVAAKSRNGKSRDDDELDDDPEPPRRRSRVDDDDDLDDEDRPRKRRGRDDDDLDDDDRPARKRRRDEDDDLDDEDRPRKKRRRDEDEDDLDDEDRPRKKRRDDDDDLDDDRPRKKRRRDDDEDDLDDEDRPRKKRRRDDDDDDDDYDDRRKRKGKSGGGWTDAWPRVRLGFLLAFIGSCVYLGGYGLSQLSGGIFNPGIIIKVMFAFGSGIQFGGGLDNVLDVINKIAVFVVLGGLITTVVGFVFWIFVTNRNGKLGFAIATLATGSLAAIFFLAFELVPTFDVRSRPSSQGMFIFLSILRSASLTAMWVLAALYLKSVSAALADKKLARSVMMLLITAGIAGGIELLHPIIRLAFQSGGRVANIFDLILTVLGTAAHAFQMVLFILAFKRARNTTDVR